MVPGTEQTQDLRLAHRLVTLERPNTLGPREVMAEGRDRWSHCEAQLALVRFLLSNLIPQPGFAS
jgi:hypothetical protein